MAIIISDAGPLIAFIDAGAFDELILEHEEIIVPTEVQAEVFGSGRRAKPRQVKSCALEGAVGLQLFAQLRPRLDPGESAALALAQIRALPVLIDERLGTKIANELGIPTSCSADILQSLVRRKAVTVKRARLIVRKMRESGTFLPDIQFTA